MGKKRDTSGSEDLKQRWPVMAMMALLAIGCLIAINLVWHHENLIYGSTEAKLVGCADESTFDCDKVNTSDESELFGIPISVFAIPTYLAMIGLGVLALRGRRRTPMAHAFAIGLATVLYSIFLFYVSKVQLGALCLWCMSLYAVNLGSAVLAWLSAGEAPLALLKRSLADLSPSSPSVRVGAAVLVGAMVLSVGGQKSYRRSLEGGQRVDLAEPAVEDSDAGENAVEDDQPGVPTPRSIEVVQKDGTTALLPIGPEDLWKGNPESTVVVTKFADFQCGYCKRLGSELRRLKTVYGDRVLFVFKHFPMSPNCNPGVTNNRHAQACSAAEAAECARQQGRFWAYHDITYKNQHDLRPDALRAYAEKCDLDLDAFDSCVASGETSARVLARATEATAIGVKSTPSLYINGEAYRGARTAEAIAFQIEQALGAEEGKAREMADALKAEAGDLVVPDGLPEMLEIRHGDMHFLIDTFEASIQDGKAVSGKGNIPATAVSWYQAEAACRAAGKRLCTEREWVAACQGAQPVDDDGDGQFADDMIEGTAYPHSDYHVRGVCWDDKDRNANRPVYTGSMPGCRTLDGAYDMTGNVSEWVGASEKEAVVLGGGYDTAKDKARCYRRNSTYGPGSAAYRNGFRCCDTPGS